LCNSFDGEREIFENVGGMEGGLREGVLVLGGRRRRVEREGGKNG
jgi:hypothetical protein